ncbi:hypothetical protein CYY_005663 [Polysphondylium violaceum]|uniref:ABC transporter C family protein n=1 Tax=Polysphondylium violaceum TaxID=133409 RepID=A0A8J4PT55_9MYCE|nr:hypothetical protein CYY_005663 [Polysphondylium violaceum]
MQSFGLGVAKYLRLVDTEDQDPADTFRQPCPEQNASIYSKITFQWIQKLLFKGYFNGPLQLEDVSDLPEVVKVSNSFKNIRNLDFNSKYSLLKYIYIHYALKHRFVIFIKLISLLFSIVTPLVLKLFLYYVTIPDRNIFVGWGICFALFISAMILNVSLQQAYWHGMKLCLQVRGALISLIFKKMLLLNNTSRRKYKVGTIINLISVDSDSFQNYFWNNYIDIVIFPIQIFLLIVLLCVIVGPAGLIGFVVMGLSLPLSTYASRTMSKYLRASYVVNDERVHLISELIGGIRFLKQCAWETVFTEKIEEARARQLEILFKRILYWILNQVIVQSTGALVLLATFSVYILLGHQLTASVAFTSLTIFLNLRKSMEMLPVAVQRLLGLLPSSIRLQEFFGSSEVQHPPFSLLDDHNDQDNDGFFTSRRHGETTSGEVRITSGVFDWNDGVGIEEDEEQQDNSSPSIINDNQIEMENIDDGSQMIMLDSAPTLAESQVQTAVLQNVNFTAPNGKLTVICGQVGCGKTSLISALIGEIYRVNGTVSTPKSISFTSQQAFLVSATLRENILFGKPYDKERYAKVIYACSLNTDLLQLPAKDLTEIGERGINLSGGQKQRISLARALYSDAECFILDEPLSAVDPEVGKHLFDHCIQGMMQGKTRILVTHQLQFIPSADHIVVIQDGNLIQGTYSELQQLGIDFESIMKTKKLNIEPEDKSLTMDDSASPDKSQKKEISIESIISDETNPSLIEKSKLLVKEDRNKGSVKISLYKDYIQSGGPFWFFCIGVIGLFLVSQVIMQASEYWISMWTSRSIQPDPGDRYYVTIYLIFVTGFMLLLSLRYFILSRYTFNASSKLHNTLLDSVTYAPCHFFDTNPSGRIINRFSKDVADIDNNLMETFSDFLYFSSSVLVALVTMIFLNPFIILPFILLSMVYVVVQRIYVASSRELKRMESISRSPVFNTVSECYNGLTTIRAFGEQKRFINDFQTSLSINIRLIYYSYAIHRWIGTRMEMLASAIVFFSSILTLYNSSSTAGTSGLAVTAALGMTGFLNRSIRNFTELELRMNSVERIKKYIETPREGAEDDPNFEPLFVDPSWPKTGCIEYKNVEIRYRPHLDPSLADISFTINGNEKIGIVGRTGAGKSTIGVSLLRMVEATKGSISIDGVDISKIRLYDLRSRLGIIPQDPFIFSGSIRMNLDPYEEYTDQEIWEALEKVQLKTMVQGLPLKMDSLVSENGEGLSVGQKQLLCLSRALLRNSKIVLMDEATASLDYQTDYIIKQTVKNNFQNSTVLTIAHRLDTIIDSDKILVIDKGQMVEFDSPQNLVNNPNSRFAQIVNAQTSFLYNTSSS